MKRADKELIAQAIIVLIVVAVAMWAALSDPTWFKPVRP